MLIGDCYNSHVQNQQQIKMDGMNFLHKKYTSSFNQSLSHSRSSRSFLPPQSSSISREPSQRQHQPPNNLPQQNIISNHCPTHSQELIRHMCTDCIELLCSECIGEHIAIHKETNSFPNICTLKQLKQDMNFKLSEMVQFMMAEENHPKCIDADSIRKESNSKIDDIRREMIMVVEDWVLKLRNSVVNNVGYEELNMIKGQMHTLQEEVNALNNSLISANTSVQAIKKAYQIDGQKLHRSYKAMVDKYQGIKNSLAINLDIDQQKFIQALDSCLSIKVGDKDVIKVDHRDHGDQGIDLPLQYTSPYQSPQETKKQSAEDDCLGLFEFPPGSSIFSHLMILDSSTFSPLNSYNVNAQTYPLNSVALLPDNMLVVSGGMISESTKNKTVEIVDYSDGSSITKAELNDGRSSHSTVPFRDRIFFIGGFTNEGECQTVEILTGEGMVESEHLCKWGGPNLCVLTPEGVVKIALAGVEIMDLESLKWRELNSNVPFSLGKGMQAQYYSKLKKIYVFGQGRKYYEWSCKQAKFVEKSGSVELGAMKSSTVRDDGIYGLDEQRKVAHFDGQEWKVANSKG